MLRVAQSPILTSPLTAHFCVFTIRLTRMIDKTRYLVFTSRICSLLSVICRLVYHILRILIQLNVTTMVYLSIDQKILFPNTDRFSDKKNFFDWSYSSFIWQLLLRNGKYSNNIRFFQFKIYQVI